MFYSYFPCRILKCFTYHTRTWQQILFTASKTSASLSHQLAASCMWFPKVASYTLILFHHCYLSSATSQLYICKLICLLFSIPLLTLSCMSDHSLHLNSSFSSKIFINTSANNTTMLILLSHNLSGYFHSKLPGTRSLPSTKNQMLGWRDRNQDKGVTKQNISEDCSCRTWSERNSFNYAQI